jgi:hypothetical protein
VALFQKRNFEMKMSKTIALTGFTLVALVFSSASMAGHVWAKYHWERSTNPVILPLGDNLDGAWVTPPEGYEEYLKTASTDWNNSTVVMTNVVSGSASARRCKAASGTVEVCNLTYGNNGWLGLASITVSGDHITSGYVKLNDTYFNTTTYNTPEWRQMVVCQEVGHTFGLGHQDENFNNSNLDTCMDYTSDPKSNQHPNAHDYEQLKTIYKYLDSGGDGGGGGGGCNPRSPKCNGASAADILASIEMNGPAQWGRLVSGHGPQEVYELDFGGGRKVITFVTWTLERAQNHQH